MNVTNKFFPDFAPPLFSDDLDAATAAKVLNMDFAFSRILSISPLPLLRLFSGVVEVNLLQTGQEVKPYWTNELAKLQGILFAINEWQRVDIGGIESTADGKFRFLMWWTASPGRNAQPITGFAIFRVSFEYRLGRTCMVWYDNFLSKSI